MKIRVGEWCEDRSFRYGRLRVLAFRSKNGKRGADCLNPMTGRTVWRHVDLLRPEHTAKQAKESV